MEKTWQMNDTQKAFVNELNTRGGEATLFEMKLDGKVFKTGSINSLITKGVVEIVGEREYACEVVYNGQTVGKVTKTAKVYKVK